VRGLLHGAGARDGQRRVAAVRHAYPATVRRRDEGGQVGGDEVHHAVLDRLLGRQAQALANRALGPLDVTPPGLREGADPGGGIVDDLALHRTARRGLRRVGGALAPLAVVAALRVLGGRHVGPAGIGGRRPAA